jgi:hypothetical protein
MLPMIRWTAVWTALPAVFFLGGSAAGQMLNTTVPAGQLRSGSFEDFAFTWSLRGDRFFAQSGGPPRVPFGNAVAGSGLRGGGLAAGGGIRGSLGFSLAQGSSQTVTSSAATVTALPGAPAAISSQTIRPFVTGVTPIVGGFRYGDPIRDNAGSQMWRAYSDYQSRQLQQRAMAAAEAKQANAQESFDRGLRAERDGDLRRARANYRRALGWDQGPLRQRILQRLQRF